MTAVASSCARAWKLAVLEAPWKRRTAAPRRLEAVAEAEILELRRRAQP